MLSLKNHAVNIALTIVSTLFCLYLTEIYLQFSKSEVSDRYSIASQMEDTLPAYAPWELWQTKTGAFQKIDGDEIFPVGAISNQRTLYCKEAAGWLEYTSDMFGFNNDPLLLVEIIEGQKILDTLFVGDSFVHGACVPVDSNFQGNFIKFGRVALGFGIGGNGPMMYLSAIKEYGELLRPKNIMFMYYEGNDIPQLRAEKTSPLIKYLEINYKANLVDHQQEIDNRLRFEVAENYIKLDKVASKKNNFQEFLWSFFTLKEINKKILSLASPPKISCEWDYKDYKSTGELEFLIRAVKEAERYSREINSNFYFVYMGSINSLVNTCNYAKMEIIRTLQNVNIEVIDTTSIFNHSRSKYELFSLGRRGGHYSKKGYLDIARFIDASSQ